MSKYSLSKRSRERMDKVHPDLVAVVELAIQRTPVDFTVTEGVRTVERQRELVAKGASRTMQSYHLPQASGYAHAVDLAPLVGGQIPWEDWGKFQEVATAMKSAAAELGVPLEWGGDWKSFRDGPHFQIPRDWRGPA